MKELDDFKPFDCQTMGRQIDPFEMLRLLRVINLLVAERNQKHMSLSKQVIELEQSINELQNDMLVNRVNISKLTQWSENTTGVLEDIVSWMRKFRP